MSEEMLRKAIEQERVIRFRDVDLALIDRIGRDIHQWALDNGRSIYILIRVNGFAAYASSTDGVSMNNAHWAARKARLAEKFWKSSLRVTLEIEKDSRTLEELGLSGSDYGFSGGSFPILLKGVCIGSVTVSGMKGPEDHQAAADALCRVLSIPAPESVLS